MPALSGEQPKRSVVGDNERAVDHVAGHSFRARQFAPPPEPRGSRGVVAGPFGGAPHLLIPAPAGPDLLHSLNMLQRGDALQLQAGAFLQ